MLQFEPGQYELLDFGAGRKLERFGRYVLDRPCPAAAGEPRQRPADWPMADARYERASDQKGAWICGAPVEQPWTVRCGSLSFELKLTPFGHVGLFPEQVENWAWIERQARAAQRALKVLNLFAYTGGSTMAATAAGCQVTHVDAAANVVAWARRNAEKSGLADAPIRWIAEDALTFACRELKRGNCYDAVILDPPSYGHGPKGEPWKIGEHLDELWRICQELLGDEGRFFLLTCHSTDFDLAGWLHRHKTGKNGWRLLDEATRAVEMTLAARGGRRLASGMVARGGSDAKPDSAAPAQPQTRRAASHAHQNHHQPD